MAARPGRVIRELAIDAPYPRGDRFPNLFRLCRSLPDNIRGTPGLDEWNRLNRPAIWHCEHEQKRPSCRVNHPRTSRWPRPKPGRMFSMTRKRRRMLRRRVERIGKWCLPAIVLVVTVWYWDRIVFWNEIPHYILPGPGRVASTLLADWPVLLDALVITLQITFLALAVAVIGGAGLAILFTQSRLIQMSLFPYAVILQVTPIVAIAPLIFIYVDSKIAGLLICAWIVAFFPILSNTTLGLNSTDHNLRDLFRIYGASRWQQLLHLQIPTALPYFLGGLRIAGGLALIGAVVGGICCRHGRDRIRAGFHHTGGGLPAEHPPNVRRAAPDCSHRCADFHGPVPVEPPAAPQVA